MPHLSHPHNPSPPLTAPRSPSQPLAAPRSPSQPRTTPRSLSQPAPPLAQVCATLKVALPTLAPPGGSGGARRAGGTRTALFTATADGGLGLLAPLGEAPYRRLSFLTTKLVAAVSHAAGLNPRAFRAHRSGAVSARELKFIVDGSLLRHFTTLDAATQDGLAHQIGTTPAQLLADIDAVSESAVRSLSNC